MKRADGGVHAAWYVLHINNPRRAGFTYCGRVSARVNVHAEPEKLTEDEGCRNCVKRRAKEPK